MQFRVYNKTLDKNLWDEQKQLSPEVRAILLKIAKDYYDGNEDIEGALVDADVVGSSANYNWTPDSDLDIHLVIDSSKLDLDEEQARTMFELMSHKWNQSHDIKIKGHKVELYLQDTKHQVRSSGIYSLTNGQWVKEPHPEKVEIDEEHIKQKYHNMAKRIDASIQSEDVGKMKKVMEDLRNQRNTGLDKSGEFSAENIVFKMLRKFGYIKKLKDATHKVYDREMTLTEELEDPRDLIIGYITPSLHVKAGPYSQIKGHGDFPEIRNWIINAAWRFRRDLNILFWWDVAGGITQDMRDTVTDFLEKEYAARNIQHRQLVPGEHTNQSSWKLSHGVDEMAQISRRGKTAYAGDVPLKGMKVEKVEGNIVVFRQPNAGEFVPEGYTMVYFLDSDEAAEEMRKGKIPYLIVPRGTFHSGGSPITDIWKKRFQKPGTEHILGHIEGNTSEEDIFIDMITVRPGWQRNHIAKLMVNALKQSFPSAKLTHSSTTPKGEKFFSATQPVDETLKLASKFWWIDPKGKPLKVGENPGYAHRGSNILDLLKSGFVFVGYSAKHGSRYLEVNYDKEKNHAHQWLAVKHIASQMGADEVYDTPNKRNVYLKEQIQENIDEWWITGLTTEKLETVSEKYSGNINNITHRHLSFKYHFTGRVVSWRYVHSDNSVRFLTTPGEAEKQEVYAHLSNQYHITPQKTYVYGVDRTEKMNESVLRDEVWLGYVDPKTHYVVAGSAEDYFTHAEMDGADSTAHELEREFAPKWRYRKDLNRVFWWGEIPDNDIQDSLEEWLHKNLKVNHPQHVRLLSFAQIPKDQYAISQAHGTQREGCLQEGLIFESPQQKNLKKNRTPLTPEERAAVMKAGAVWHHGPNGEETPAVWKAVVDGKAWYCCNTHRAIHIKKTLRGAIKAFEFIKTTA